MANKVFDNFSKLNNSFTIFNEKLHKGSYPEFPSNIKRILEKIPKVEFYPNFLRRNFLKMVDPPAAFKFKVSDKNTWLIPPENVGKPEVV